MQAFLFVLLAFLVCVTAFQPRIVNFNRQLTKQSSRSMPFSPMVNSRGNFQTLMTTEALEVPKPKSKFWEAYVKTTDVLTTLFPVWTVLFAGLALKKPESFAWFTTKYFAGSLGKG